MYFTEWRQGGINEVQSLNNTMYQSDQARRKHFQGGSDS